MDWLERYLQAVRKHLPWQRQDDIIAELRANLESQLQDRQEELGRPLTEGEILDWLKELGPPMVMAFRYQPVRHLIGPNIYGIYWMILRLAVLWTSVAFTIAIVVRTIVESHDASWIGLQLLHLPNVWLQAAAWVTLVFAVGEYLAARYPQRFACGPGSNWSPAKLPPVEKREPANGRPRTYAAAVSEFIVHSVLVIWLLLIPSHPWLMLGPAAAYLSKSPVLLLPVVLWFYWAVVVVNAVRVAWLGYLLLAEDWRYKTAAQHLLTKAIEMVPTFILITAPGHQYVMARPGANPLPVGLQIDAVNHYIWVITVIIGAITATQLVVDLVKAASGPRGSSTAVVF